LSGRTKLAVSLAPAILAAVERLRSRTGESRSAVVSRALERLTNANARAKQVDGYVQAYRDRPEKEADVTAARAHAKKAIPVLPWDDE
jgi:metal-responsive CopG/Arc/MetJ family transcriptional regulator